MKTKELIEYLSKFNGDDPVCILPVAVDKRIYFKVMSYQYMLDPDVPTPVLIFELGESSPLEEVLEEAGP